MDRKLQLLKSGYPLAELTFKYETQTSGSVKIELNRIIDLKGDIKSVVPLYLCNESFEHETLMTITEIETFDQLFIKQFIKQIDNLDFQLEDPIEFMYPPESFRYLISGEGVIGIANIQANFPENKKEMQFISASRMNEDNLKSSFSVESNVNLMRQLFAEDDTGLQFNLADRAERF